MFVYTTALLEGEITRVFGVILHSYLLLNGDLTEPSNLRPASESLFHSFFDSYQLVLPSMSGFLLVRPRNRVDFFSWTSELLLKM